MPYRHTRRPYWKKYMFEIVTVTFGVCAMVTFLVLMNWYWHFDLFKWIGSIRERI
jgi:hypothetical protein